MFMQVIVHVCMLICKLLNDVYEAFVYHDMAVNAKVRLTLFSSNYKSKAINLSSVYPR